ncbi:type III PLP-dependent enzyme [Paenibacillus sp. YPG26]|uniref:type III PLP-dependent enzyme n=1 Tax=Paenibacillus sp. YPG26 TaxID=2878915 RepID=UPI002040F941|nr:type III PLP-dependent enzyme [Paenibacillus sp. YPG26]USB31596.1 type III PLP-dependent enzyme [Paenibacillus sp. YPG26]
MNELVLTEDWTRAAKSWIQGYEKRDTGELLCAFVYDLESLRKHARDVVQALPDYCRMYYAMKANSEEPILNTIYPYVTGFETASIGEIRKARAVSADVPIIFGGPGKTDEELREAVLLNVERIHVESLHELRRLIHLTERSGTEVTVLLRVNISMDRDLPEATLQMGGRPTQFGMEAGSLNEAARLLKGARYVRMAGFHLHTVSNQMDADEHLALIDRYINTVESWMPMFKLDRLILNAGGGIGVNYADLDKQFDWQRFTEGLHQLGQSNQLITSGRLVMNFECGRYLAAFCGTYVTEVIDVKHNHGKTYVIVRGGTQHFRLPVSWKHNHPFEILEQDRWDYPFPRPTAADAPVTVVGQLCTPKDVFADHVHLPKVRSGDLLLFILAGAYGWAISHHDFLSHPHPQLVYI